jgi:hypothetical protein
MHMNRKPFELLDSPTSITYITEVSQLQLASSDFDSVLVHKEKGMTLRMPQC